MEYLIVAGYIACCVSAWLILVDDWRKLWDLKLITAILFGVFSIFGPISLIVALIVWAIGWSVDKSYDAGNKPVWRKK